MIQTFMSVQAPRCFPEAHINNKEAIVGCKKRLTKLSSAYATNVGEQEYQLFLEFHPESYLFLFSCSDLCLLP